MNWHLDSLLIDRYREGDLARSAASSVEVHLTRCSECRSLVPVEAERAARTWVAIAERIEPSPPTLVERLLSRLIPRHLARLVAVTPGLRPSWLAAITLVVGFAALAVTAGPPSPTGVNLFLAIAPLVPVAGVALAYGRAVDPAHEITLAAPIDAFRLLLIRTAAVTTAAVTITLTVDVLAPLPGSTAAWVLPSLALTLVTLALGTKVSLGIAAGAVAGGWLTLVGSVAAGQATLALFPSANVLMYVVAMAASGLVLARRYDHYRRGDI